MNNTNKLIRDINNVEAMDNMFTAALEALETYEYATAYTYATIVERDSISVEQRCAAMAVKLIAKECKDDSTDEFFERLYKNL